MHVSRRNKHCTLPRLDGHLHMFLCLKALHDNHRLKDLLGNFPSELALLVPENGTSNRLNDDQPLGSCSGLPTVIIKLPGPNASEIRMTTRPLNWTAHLLAAVTRPTY